LESLKKQTITPSQVIIVIDFDVAKTPLLEKISKIKFDFEVKVVTQNGYGVCAARNFGVQKVSSEYVVVCDDDIYFHEVDILERMLDQYTQEIRNNDGGVILYPTILLSDTGKIQSQGFTGYNWFLCRPIPKFGSEWKSKLRQSLGLNKLFKSSQKDEIQLSGNICLFSSRDTFIHNQRDENFGFIYEDLEWSYRAYKNKITLINPEEIEIQHRERKKDKLSLAFISTPEQVYLKTKHRIWFVLKHANIFQKLLFYCFGFWISNLWTLAMIVVYGKRKNSMIASLRKGIGDGLAMEG
jgi:glycosyltransferase involved in cell wall biosynthesis